MTLVENDDENELRMYTELQRENEQKMNEKKDLETEIAGPRKKSV